MNLTLRIAHLSRQAKSSRLTSAVQWGFTIVELLVVIAVIGILATILIPSLKRAKGSAKAAECKSNLRQIGIGLRLYVDEFDKYPAVNPGDGWTWHNSLLAYCGGNRKLFHCSDWNSSPDWEGSSYAYNLELGRLDSTNSTVVETSVKVPSDMIAIGENCGYGLIAGFGWPGCAGHYQPHSLSFNALFCDGHVESGRAIPKGAFNQYKPDENHTRRFFRDNEPHRELWPSD
jgi:prepilin-type N-terminal cleavage/methylation domain-containing protein/prepilin-type processing-associated H-X9-DG protein